MKSTRIRILTIGAAVMLAAGGRIAQGQHGFGGPGGTSITCSGSAQTTRSDQRSTDQSRPSGKKRSRPCNR